MSGPVKPSKVFGGGDAYGINNADVPTPTVWDTIQDQSLSVKQDVVTLHGTGRLPADVSAGKMSISGKITCGSLTGRAFSDLLFDAGSKSQQDRIAKRERHNIANDETVRVANAAGFIRDLGVIDPAANTPLVRVAVGESIAGNHYSCTDKGVYVVHPDWDGENLDFSYQYALDGVKTSAKVTLLNQDMGESGTFTMVQSFNWRQEMNVFVLNSCIVDSFELASKQGGYATPTWGFQASVDDLDQLGTLSFAQKR